MSDDFIMEEEEGGGSSGRGPFLIAVGALLLIFILAATCILIVRSIQGSTNQLAEAATIEAQNAIILITNEAVTQTIAAIETENARPATETPEPPPTETGVAVPTDTATSTATSVVQQGGSDEGEGTDEATADATTDGTADAVAEGGDTNTPTPNISGTSLFGATGDNTPTPITALNNSETENDQLPQTGISTWGALVAAAVLIVTLVAARRLRGA